jgi:hypothetical protein
MTPAIALTNREKDEELLNKPTECNKPIMAILANYKTTIRLDMVQNT